MIKAVVFVDGELRHCLNITNSLEKFQNPLTRFLYIDAKYGYTDTQEYIEEILEDDEYKKFEIIIITNSLIVFNDSELKEEVCSNSLLEGYYIIDKNNKLIDLRYISETPIPKYQNLEEMYIHNLFNVYDLTNKGDKNVKE